MVSHRLQPLTHGVHEKCAHSWASPAIPPHVPRTSHVRSLPESRAASSRVTCILARHMHSRESRDNSWAAELGLPISQLGGSSDFRALSGDSLMALKICMRLWRLQPRARADSGAFGECRQTHVDSHGYT